MPTAAECQTIRAIASTVTAKLHQERVAHCSATADLERLLAAVHGELLRLRRTLDQHDPWP